MPPAESGEALLEPLKLGFEAAHEQLYGYLAPEEPIQLVTFRLEAQGLVRKAELRRHEPPHTEVTEALIDTREMYLPERDGFVACPVFDRERLGPGHELEGPAIVEQMDSTTVILPGQRARVDPYLNLLIRVERP